jgi:hypothetical protein
MLGVKKITLNAVQKYSIIWNLKVNVRTSEGEMFKKVLKL